MSIDDLYSLSQGSHHLHTALHPSKLLPQGTDVSWLDGKQGGQVWTRVEGHSSLLQAGGEVDEDRRVEDALVNQEGLHSVAGCWIVTLGVHH